MSAAGLRVVVADANLAPLREEFEAALPTGTQVSWPGLRDPGAVEAALTDTAADVLVSGVCTASTAAAGRGLRLVHAAGAGTEKIEVSALPPGAQVANTFHHEDSMAEYAVSAAVLLRRGFLRQDTALRQGRWDSPAYDPRVPWPESLAAATVGFVGFGHIGTRTWQRFRAFGARGVAVTRRGDTDSAAHSLAWSGSTEDLGALLECSDVVIVSVPLTPATTGLIGASQLARMRASSVLVNVGRGPVVDEGALYSALSNRTIGAAAIDVWYSYPASGHTGPPGRHPFHDLENVLMTPHTSGITRQTFTRRAAGIAANISRLAAGEPLQDVVAVAR